MEALYWAIEYESVLLSYLFLMFLWPIVVFGGHLKGKPFTYRFGFCVTVQPVLVSTVVLGLGFFHVLNRRLIAGLFYGVFLVFFLNKAIRLICRTVRLIWQIIRERMRGQKDTVRLIKRKAKESIWDFSVCVWSRLLEYVVLSLVILSGVLYFSYGSSQLHGYGCGDLYVHHSWIYGLIEGKIFSDGIYPQAMHCFVYCLNALFGIQVYSILLYLQCVHVVVFLFSAYCLLKEAFHWKYTPVLVLALYLMLDVVGANMIYGISRLQWTLPLEFGLYTPFLCALFLVRYLKNGYVTVHITMWKGKELKYCLDSNLFLFMMAVAASVAIHYYAAVMAFLLCISFAVFAWKKIFSRERFIPLCCAALCGTLVAAAPMTGALASGTPFNYSLLQDINSMDGESTREDFQREQEVQNGQTGQKREAEPESRQNIFHLIWEKLSGIYHYGYVRLYGEGRARGILILTGIAVCLEVIYRRRNKDSGELEVSYAPLLLISLLFILTYAMPYMGFAELIPGSRSCSTGNMVILAVACIPFDAFFARMFGSRKDIVQQRALAFSVAGICLVIFLTGSYRGFLFYEFMRYDSAVIVTNSIIEAFPKYSFLIVSPTDELYPVIEYGWHEELATFVQNCEKEDYTVAPEYVFIYVEKKPFLYAQPYFFEGPSWLGQGKKYFEEYIKYSEYRKMDPEYDGEFIASHVSAEEAQNNLANMANPWELYRELESRIILESKAYEWCRQFMSRHPDDMKVYYEDEDFICYYLMQDINAPYQLGVK